MDRKTGFVADGFDRHRASLDAEYGRSSADLQQRLLDPELNLRTRSRLEQELADLEQEYKTQLENSKHNLY